MKKTVFFLAAMLLFSVACNQAPQSGANETLGQLRKQKQAVDAQLSDSTLLVYAKVAGKKDLEKVENKRYPRGIETTYNVLKDKDGKVVYVAEMPYNETSDWFISYKSYFDSTGKLFAFQRLNNFLNNECTRGAAMENLLKFYDADHTVVDSVYTLTDSYKKPLDKGACKFPYDFPYEVFRTAGELEAARQISFFKKNSVTYNNGE